jgi:hypothetical protein
MDEEVKQKKKDVAFLVEYQQDKERDKLFLKVKFRKKTMQMISSIAIQSKVIDEEHRYAVSSLFHREYGGEVARLRIFDLEYFGKSEIELEFDSLDNMFSYIDRLRNAIGLMGSLKNIISKNTKLVIYFAEN